MAATRRCKSIGVALLITILATRQANADTTGSVRGFVRCADCGTPPFQNTTVTLSGPSGFRTAMTDARGFYVIFGIIPGRYEISALNTRSRWRSAWPQLWRWYALRYVCIHAGEDETVSLDMRRIGPHGFFYAPWVRRNLEEQLHEPDASQTADVYTVGGCG